MRLRAFPERTLVMKTITDTTNPTIINKEQGWNRNTDLCVDVKTFLRNDRIAKMGKDYQGVLTRDQAYHYTFVEALPATRKRNPQVFDGKFITITRRDDGSLRPNFKNLEIGRDFSIDSFAIGVCNELRAALTGLIEK